MIGNKLIFICYVLSSVFSLINCEISDKRLCANADCTKPISGAVTQILYNSVDEGILSFKPKEAVLVYSKSAGTRPDLWGVKINGISGYVPHKFLRELKVYDSKPNFIVSTNNKPETPDTENDSAEENPSDAETDSDLNNNENDQVQPDKVKQAHEVIDGTTIYSHEDYTEDDEQLDDSKEEHDEIQDDSNKNDGDGKRNSLLNNYLNPSNLNSEDLNKNSDKINKDSNNVSNNSFSDVNQDTTKPEEQAQHLPPVVSTTEHPESVENLKPTSAEDSTELDEMVSTTPPYVEKTTPIESINVVSTTSEPQQNNLEAQETTTKNTTEENENVKNLDLVPADENQENNILSEKNQENSTPATTESPETPLNDSVPDLNKPEVPSSETVNPDVKPTIGEEIINDNDEIKVREPTLNSGANSLPEPAVTNEKLPPMILPTIPLLSVSSAGPSVGLSGELDNLSVANVNVHNAVEDNISQVVSETKPDTANINEYKILEEQVNQILQAPEPVIDNTNIDNGEDIVKPENVLDQKIEVSFNEPLPSFPMLETPPNMLEKPLSNTEQDSEQQATESSNGNIDGPPFVEQILEPQSPQLEPLKSYQEEIVSPPPATSENSHMPTENIIQETEPKIESTSAEVTDNGFFAGILNMFSSNKVENMDTNENYDPKIDITRQEPEILASDDSASSSSFVDVVLSSLQNIISSGSESKELFSAPGETCMPSDFCDISQRQSTSSRLLLLLVISATTVLTFTLGYYYIDNKRQDGRLVAMVNSLQRDLLCSTKECDILKDELTATKEKLTGIEDSSFGTDEMVLSLKEELEELKRRNDKLSDSLDENEKLLRVSENTASELQNTLGDLLNERAAEEDQMMELNDKLGILEDNMIEITKERDELKQKLAATTKIVDSLKGLPDAITQLKENLKQSNETVESQRYEIASLKESFKQFQSGDVDTMQIASVLDQTELKAKLTQLQDENKALSLKCETESKNRASLEEELLSIRETLQSTEEQAMESTTRLEVLGKYFKERESELLKELSNKESLWLSKQGESISTVEKIEALQQEVQQYKDQADSARRELAECEARARAAAAAGEARAHSAWLEARAAARESAAHRDEATALRRKLAQAVARQTGASPLQQIGGERLASPLEQLDGVPLAPLPPPLPPLAFLPPPPGLLPPLPRPPPLGRLPSPSPPPLGYTPTTVMADSPDSRYTERRYSPESRAYSPDSRIFSPNRRSQYSPEPRRSRYYNKDRYYNEHSPTRGRNHFVTETETDFSPPGSPHPRSRNRRYSRRSGSSGSGRSSESLEKL